MDGGAKTAECLRNARPNYRNVHMRTTILLKRIKFDGPIRHHS